MIDIVSEHPFLKGLDQSLLEAIAGCAKNEVYDAGAYLFREGEPAHSFYLIRHGKIALEMFGPGRGSIAFLTVNEGECLGFSSLIEPFHSLYDAQAVQQTRVITFDHQCLLDKCDSDVDVGYQVLKRMLPPLVRRLQAARMQCANLYGQA